jgi:iron complex outermembrane receptor protein
MFILSVAGWLALARMGTAAENTNAVDLTNLSIEQLMDIKVSILGPSETVSKTPAAVSVVTQDDIRRSGARNIPEALRQVPGLDVAQVDASQWAVSARGFNDVFANKLLVLQDGRSIYTPLFSGVLWDAQGTLMEDVDHIEVVRGPGATLWGANAVNGVINIITKSAADTQGGLATGGGGSQERGFAGARYGGTMGSNAFYRVYGTYENHDETELPDGGGGNNSWQVARGGFRTDWEPTAENTFTLQGDGYAGWINQVFRTYDPANPPTLARSVRDSMEIRGANVLGRWTHTFSDTSELKLQAYYDRTERDAPIIHEARDTLDLDLQHSFAVGDRNELIWGADYRLSSDRERNNPTISFTRTSEVLNFISAFVQDEIALVKDRLSLTVGSKLEHNDYSGLEVQPGARLLWTPVARQTFWTSVSRAVRTPSRVEESIILNQSREVAPNFFVPLTTAGSQNFKSEELMAYEAGYRTQPCKKISLDVALFYNDYDRLRSIAQQSSFDPTQFYLANNISGDTYGAEATATWRVLKWWRLQPSYTWLQMNLQAHTDSNGYTDTAGVQQAEGSSPQNQFSLRSSMDLPHGVTFDTTLRYVDRLPAFRIGSYFELEARLGWQITKNLEVAVVGQNLLHDRHEEFGPSSVQTQNGNVSAIPRSVYGKVTWRF